MKEQRNQDLLYDRHISIDANYVFNQFIIFGCRSVKNMATHLTLNYQSFLDQLSSFLGDVGTTYIKLYPIYDGFINASVVNDVFSGRAVIETSYRAATFIFESQIIGLAKKHKLVSTLQDHCDLKMRIMSHHEGVHRNAQVEFEHTRYTPMGSGIISIPCTYIHSFGGPPGHGLPSIIVSLGQVRDMFYLNPDGSEDFPPEGQLPNRPFSTEELTGQEERYEEALCEAIEEHDMERYGADGPPDHLFHPNQIIHPLRFDPEDPDTLLPVAHNPVYTQEELELFELARISEAAEFRSWTRHFHADEVNQDPM
jgi:hypothetical protein